MESTLPLNTRSFAEFAKAVITGLRKIKLEYALTGALAASYYGIPRTTLDVDFRIRTSLRGLPRLFRALKDAELEVDSSRAMKILRSGYNVISFKDSLSAHTVDFIVETRGRIHRRRGTFLGMSVFYDSPEFLVLAKLRMIKATRPAERAEKDRADILGILSQTRVSKPLITARSKQQGTHEIWKQILAQSKRV